MLNTPLPANSLQASLIINRDVLIEKLSRKSGGGVGRLDLTAVSCRSDADIQRLPAMTAGGTTVLIPLVGGDCVLDNLTSASRTGDHTHDTASKASAVAWHHDCGPITPECVAGSYRTASTE